MTRPCLLVAWLDCLPAASTLLYVIRAVCCVVCAMMTIKQPADVCAGAAGVMCARVSCLFWVGTGVVAAPGVEVGVLPRLPGDVAALWSRGCLYL